MWHGLMVKTYQPFRALLKGSLALGYVNSATFEKRRLERQAP